ncbi:MAG: hypothetical protein ABI647_20595 [Gemmatimonadota bacterium]
MPQRDHVEPYVALLTGVVTALIAILLITVSPASAAQPTVARTRSGTRRKR